MGKKLLVVAGAALYIVSPIDLIPDLIPVLGWIDDGGVLVGTVAYLMKSQPKEGPNGRPKA